MNIKWPYLLFIPLILFAIYVGKFVTTAPTFVIGLFAAVVIAMITFRKPEDGLLILIFSMLLSPELKIADVPSRSVVIRIDDLLLVAVLLAWLAHTAFDKEWKGFIKTPLDKPLLILFSIYVISTILGILNGRLTAAKSFFYVLKYFEYFVLYWMTSNIITSTKDIQKYLIAGLITAGVVIIYAYSLFNSVIRVYAPFDAPPIGGHGEPASLGGYLIIITSLLLAFYATSQNKLSWLNLLLFVSIMPPFIRTLSRSSFLGIIPALLTIILFAPRKRFLLSFLLAAGIALFPVISPKLFGFVVNRIQYTFTGTTQVEAAGISANIEESTATRIDSWSNITQRWLPKHPFIGHGITGVGLVDAQIPLFIGEIGLVGFASFLYIIWVIFRASFIVLKTATDATSQGLALGLMASLVGLLVQSLGVNTFIIVRIMEPFWFLTALVVGIIYNALHSEANNNSNPAFSV